MIPSVPAYADPAAPGACHAEQDTEAAALAMARRCGTRVAVSNSVTETDQAFANTNGTITWEHHYRPVRVKRGGSWVPVDMTLVRRPDGSIAPKAAAVDVAFSGGGNATMVTVADKGAKLTLGSPLGSLPAPVLSGDTATYSEVLPGVDLQLRADVDGYSQVLVVKNARAAGDARLRELSFVITGQGLSVQADKAGNLKVADTRGRTVFKGSTPLMWDATTHAIVENSSTGAKSMATGKSAVKAARVRMPVQIDGEQLSITPSRQMLSNPTTVFPVYIDPGLTLNRFGFAVVNSGAPDTAFWNVADDAFVGSWDGGASKHRSFFSVDLTDTGLYGTHIISAQLDLEQVYASTCEPRQLEVWATGVPDEHTTWNTQPEWYSLQSSATVSKGYSSDCPSGPVPMDVTDYLTSAANEGWDGVAFGLRASDETDWSFWKRFGNNPTLSVNYTAYPELFSRTTVPSTTWPASIVGDLGSCPTGSDRPYINTRTPRLKAAYSDEDSAATSITFEWWAVAGAAPIGTDTANSVPVNQPATVDIPAGALVQGGSYKWRVKAHDGAATTAWSPWCEFTVDTTTPTVSSTDYPAEQWVGAPGRAGTFALGRNDRLDVSSYLYGLDVTPPTAVVDVANADGSATVTLTPASTGRHTLYVRSRDSAGNLSPVIEYPFGVTYDDAFARLLELNPGLSAAELESSMRETAATGLTYDEAVMTAVGEAESHAQPDGSISVMSSGGGSPCTAVAVGTARYRGDIFYAAASNYGVSHGHVGIYWQKDWIVEARSPGVNSGAFYYYGRRYCKNIEKMDVATSIATQNKAADYAYKYLRGKPYSRNLAWNKGGDISDLNCSELVYKAYKRSVNIDLDGDGGLGVYPKDIRNSPKTRTYQVIR